MAGSRQARAQPSGVRCQLLAAARLVLGEVGSAALSLRAVARQVGVSHQATAHHFGDRAGLLTALAVDGFTELAADLEKVAGTDRAAADRVVDIGVAYIDFARRQPTLFALMFDDDALHADDEALVQARLATWVVLYRAVEQAAAAGWGGSVPTHQLTIASWASAHGVATLQRGPLAGITDRAGAEQALRLLSDALS